MTGVGIMPNDRSDLAEALDLADRIEIAEIETGARPDPQIIAHILRSVTRRQPTDGPTDRALREAIIVAWRARHELQLIRENRR